MSSDASTGREANVYAIRVRDVAKHYVMFERPEDRFKQMVVPRLQRLVGRPPKRYFRDFAALNGVSLEVGRGETVGIIGRNGSGKSTLLQIICGTLQPTSGSIEVNGRIAALLELGAGFNPEFTGRENVFLNAQILGVPRQEMEWRFDDIARFADIGAFIDQPVKTYSSGMYVRLAFATAINVDPDILVVDEALAVGDEAFQRKCFARIEDIKDKGGTILFVSHGAQTIVQLCTRAVLIDAGEKILEGRPKMVVSQYQRLVNASAAGVAAIRAQIQSASEIAPAMQEFRSELTGKPEIDGISAHEGRDAELVASVPSDENGAADYFDSSLVSRSVVVSERRGAFLRDARISTLLGDPTNVLRTGRRYVFEYQVDFSVEAHGVGFGIWIRTLEGIGLGGAQTIKSPLHQIAVTPGQSAAVKWEFMNSLLPGTYFLDCGVIGHVAGERVVMNRIVDALAIRIAPDVDTIAIGKIDFNAQPYIAVKGEENSRVQ